MKLRKSAKILLLLLLVSITIGFMEKRQQGKVCNQIVIEIDNQYGNYFIDENEVRSLITANGEDYIIGQDFANIPLKKLEQRLEAHKYVQDAEVYRDLKGNLTARVQQSKPIARITRQNAPEAYISTEGEILPLSEQYTARVMLVGGPYSSQLIRNGVLKDEKNHQIFELLKFIDNDEFWKAQIAQLDIDAKGDIVMYPQVGKQYIEFGKAEQIEEKFSKLTLFYQKILPFKGWNTYNRVNLKYLNQIVCE
jgi:cell division protein FtsQ